jgi:hypothetical protein
MNTFVNPPERVKKTRDSDWTCLDQRDGITVQLDQWLAKHDAEVIEVALGRMHTEWGIQWCGGPPATYASEFLAEEAAAFNPTHTKVVHRRVTEWAEET